MARCAWTAPVLDLQLISLRDDGSGSCLSSPPRQSPIFRDAWATVALQRQHQQKKKKTPRAHPQSMSSHTDCYFAPT